MAPEPEHDLGNLDAKLRYQEYAQRKDDPVVPPERCFTDAPRHKAQSNRQKRQNPRRHLCRQQCGLSILFQKCLRLPGIDRCRHDAGLLRRNLGTSRKNRGEMGSDWLCGLLGLFWSPLPLPSPIISPKGSHSPQSLLIPYGPGPELPTPHPLSAISLSLEFCFGLGRCKVIGVTLHNLATTRARDQSPTAPGSKDGT